MVTSAVVPPAAPTRRPARVDSFCYIRAIACIAIVVLHTVFSANLLFEKGLNPVENTASRVAANCMMWAVPCFVMVTGALLLQAGRRISYRKLFSKYILRIAVLLVICCLVFRLFDMGMDGGTITVNGFFQGFEELFTGKSWSHLWYLYLLIGLYLLLPFYRMVAGHSSKNDIKYLLAIYVVFLSLLPLLKMWGVNCGFYIHVLTIYPFYLFCGYAIHEGLLKIPAWLAWLAFSAGTGAIVLFTILRWHYGAASMEMLWGYSSIFVILQAVGFFALLDRCKGTLLPLLKKVLLKIDACSLGIYLIHMLFVRLVLRYWGFNPYTHGGILAFIALVVAIFAVSYAIIWVLKKVPGLKKFL